jgi:hypothetical protein
MAYKFPDGDINLRLFANEFYRIFEIYNVQFMVFGSDNDEDAQRMDSDLKEPLQSSYQKRLTFWPADNYNYYLGHGGISLYMDDKNNLLALNLSHCSDTLIESIKAIGKVYGVQYKTIEKGNPIYNRFTFYF